MDSTGYADDVRACQQKLNECQHGIMEFDLVWNVEGSVSNENYLSVCRPLSTSRKLLKVALTDKQLAD